MKRSTLIHPFLVATSAVAILLIWFLYSKIQKRKMRITETVFLLNLLGFVLVIGGGIKITTILSRVPSSYYRKIVLSNNRIPIAEATSRQVILSTLPGSSCANVKTGYPPQPVNAYIY